MGEVTTTTDVFHNYSDGYYYDYLNDSHCDYGEDGCDYDYTDVIDKSHRVMTAVILTVVCVLGVLGNGLVIWAAGFRMKKTVSTVWYLNLAVADLLVTAAMPLGIVRSVLDYHWPFGRFLCKLDALLFYINMYASIYTLVVIGVDRCVSVVCPVWTRCSGRRTVRNASWVGMGVWVAVLAPSITHLIFRTFKSYEDHPEHPDLLTCEDHPDLHLVIVDFLFGFLLPFSAIVSCYSAVVLRLRNNRLLAPRSGRSFKTIVAVVSAFFLCWTPFHVVRLIDVCSPGRDLDGRLNLVLYFLEPITLTLALVSSCVNPLLYLFRHGVRDVRDALRSRSILKVLEKALAEEPSGTTTSTPRPSDTTSTPRPSDTPCPPISLPERLV